MEKDFKDFETEAPTLTLEPDFGQEETPKEEKEPAEAAVKKEMEETILTPEEQKLVADFAARIDIENTNQILQYGAGTQKKMADFSDAALANVKTQELGEAGDLIAEVVGELRDFDATEEKGIFGFFKKQSNKIEAMKNRYAKAEVNVQKIVDSLQEHQIRLMKDSAMLDKMYQQNLNYYKELTMYILAGKKKLEEVRNGRLSQLETKAQISGSAQDAQEAKDLDSKCNRFEKKLHDLELTKTIPTSQIRDLLDAQMTEGVHVLSARKVEDGKAGKAMSLVAAADYYVVFREGKEPKCVWRERIQEFLAQPEILITKETKKGTKEVDIRPCIYQMEQQEQGIFMKLASASSNYTKPEAVMNSFCSWLKEEMSEFPWMVKRLEVYADLGSEDNHRFVTLEALGEEIE